MLVWYKYLPLAIQYVENAKHRGKLQFVMSRLAMISVEQTWQSWLWARVTGLPRCIPGSGEDQRCLQGVQHRGFGQCRQSRDLNHQGRLGVRHRHPPPPLSSPTTIPLK
eukprot:jgi/Botrbrau1/12437/Bobra.0094s0006.1